MVQVTVSLPKVGVLGCGRLCGPGCSRWDSPAARSCWPYGKHPSGPSTYRSALAVSDRLVLVMTSLLNYAPGMPTRGIGMSGVNLWTGRALRPALHTLYDASIWILVASISILVA
ncbi:hypothetical protein LSAT2_018611, partial [Lamellibrachia satsuma]